MNFLDLLLPPLGRLPALAEMGAIALLLCGLGRLVAGTDRPATALVAGWGAASLGYVVLGTLTPFSFRLATAGLAVAALVGALRLRPAGAEGRAAWRRAGQVALLAIPLIAMTAGMHASQWDEFAQWLPNARYIVAHDHFPTLAEPNPGSVLPAYPYGLPLVTYWLALLNGGFAEQAGIVFNAFLLIAAGAAIAGLVAEGIARRTGGEPSGWAAPAVGLLAAGLLNPSFVPKLALTNYTDSATSCVVAITALVGVRWLEAAAAGRPDRWRLALAIGWCGAALINLRQANLILLLLILAGLALAALPELRRGNWRRLLSFAAALPAPACVAILWSGYTAAEIPGGAVQMRTLGDWHFDITGQIVGSMLTVMRNKGGHFGLMLALLVVAILVPLLRLPLERRLRALLVVAVTAFLGYTGFLFVAYLGAFSVDEGAHAASFWRYSTHLGLLGVATAAALLTAAWQHFGVRLRGAVPVAVALALLAPVALAPRLRFDASPHKAYLRAIARELAAELPRDDHIALVDLRGNGSNLVAMRYEWHFSQPGDRRATPVEINASRARDGVEAVRRLLSESEDVWVHEGGPASTKLFGVELPAGASYLLKRDGDRFVIARAWRYPPGYTDPFTQPDIV